MPGWEGAENSPELWGLSHCTFDSYVRERLKKILCCSADDLFDKFADPYEKQAPTSFWTHPIISEISQKEIIDTQQFTFPCLPYFNKERIPPDYTLG